MRFKSIILMLVILFASTGAVWAQEEAVHVNNKICPVSGQEIGTMGDGIQVEHEGKVYNLCCPMCAKDFNADPEKYIKKINKNMKSADDEEGHHMQGMMEGHNAHDHDAHDGE